MFKYTSAMFVAVVMLAACRPAPQPAPTEPPAVPAGPTAVAALTSTPTLAAPPAATSVPTTAPTIAPTVAPTTAPTVAPTAAPAQPTPAPVLRVQVNSPDVGFLNVRDAPATSGALVAQAKDGATLDVLEAADTARGKVGQSGQWLKVRTSEGKEGFVAAWYLRLPGTSPAPALQATAIPPTPEIGSTELDLFNRTNALRAQNGLPPYRIANRLNAAAQRHSQDMAITGIISHSGSDGSSIKQRVMDTGYGDWPVGEVIYGGVATVDDVWQSWSSDPDQRSQLLSPQFVDVGIFVEKGDNNTLYYTMDFGGRPLKAADSAPATSPSPAPNQALDAVTTLFNRTNAFRSQNGLPPYRLNDKLNASAERHSQDMAGTGNIDHGGSDGSTPKRRILDTGYEAQFTGENIYGGIATIDDAWNYWVNDPQHRDNLLNKLFTDIGISVVKGTRGTYYYTMDLAQ
jgi:uncharacterized protein YkwD